MKSLIAAFAFSFLPSQMLHAQPELLIAPFSESEALAAKEAWATHLATEVNVDVGAGMQLTLIPPGEFLMGSPSDEQSREDDERQHSVRLTQPFYVGLYEVTQEEWETVMGSNPSAHASTGVYASSVQGMNTNRFPVENVTWYDSIEFCNALSRWENLEEYYRLSSITRDAGRITGASVTISGGHGYRLLTEAEWEYACRAGTTTPFHFGATSNGRESNVSGSYPYGIETTGRNLKRITTVGSYSPNGFGLYDMHGNVCEWCWDGYDAEAYNTRSGTTSDPIVSRPIDRRALRGGSWYFVPRNTRSANRSWRSPDDRSIDVYGFRISRTP